LRRDDWIRQQLPRDEEQAPESLTHVFVCPQCGDSYEQRGVSGNLTPLLPPSTN
jgi:hypothetical protein